MSWNLAEMVYHSKCVRPCHDQFCNCLNTFNKTICHRENHGHKIQQTLKIDLNWRVIIVWWLVFDLNSKYHLRTFLQNKEVKFFGTNRSYQMNIINDSWFQTIAWWRGFEIIFMYFPFTMYHLLNQAFLYLYISTC